MSVSSGFFNSLEGDRKYDALQLSSLLTGLILDGVFASIGDAFVATSTNSNIVNIAVGKAWFNETWIRNDSVLPVTLPASDLLLKRIDAIVIEINSSVEVRENTIKVISGDLSLNPRKPELIKSAFVNQYPICYITRRAEDEVITQADIENMIGTADTPFVTGIIQVIDLDTLLGQWRAQLDEFVASEEADFLAWRRTQEELFEEWLAEFKAALESEKALLEQWTATEKAYFTDWFNEMKGQLSQDAAGNLQLQIDEASIKTILYNGFDNQEKTIENLSSGQTLITGTKWIDQITGEFYRFTKTISEDFKTIATVLVHFNPDTGFRQLARMTKTFSDDGLTSTTTTNIY